MTQAIQQVLDDKKIDRALVRISHEILEHNSGAENLALIGIVRRGAILARRIAAHIKRIEGVAIPVGFMDISLYRDDVFSKLEQPVIQRTEVPFSVKNMHIVLVDDVLFTGRTIRAALDQIVDFGRPRTIQLAVLVDRGHRELPIKADYVGINVPTKRDDQVVLEVVEQDGQDRVYVGPKAEVTAHRAATASGKSKSSVEPKVAAKGKVKKGSKS